MSPFDTYQSYLSLKSHFNNPKYDYFKYHKKTRATITTFNKRRDRYWFEKMSRKYSDEEIIEFLVSNFVASNNPQNLWIGELISSGDKVYQEWKKRQQSLKYIFKEQSNDLFLDSPLKNVLDCSKGHPILIKKYLSGNVSPETIVIYNKIFDFVTHFNKKLLDPVWEVVSLKIYKYDPFINIDIPSYKKILRDIIHE
jgi:hypothetical protein